MSQNPHVCQREDSCSSVAQRMRELNVGFLPVLEGKKVVGVVTDRDLALRHVGGGTPSSPHANVGGCMTKNVVWVRPDDPVKVAVQTMSDNKIRRLVVLEGGDLRGVLTLNDVFIQTRHSESLDRVVRETLGTAPVVASR